MPRDGFKFEMQGFKEIERALAQLPKAASRQVLRSALVKSSAPVIAEAETRAPRGATGRYAASFEAKSILTPRQRRDAPRRPGVTLYIGSTDPKAHLLEFGTSKMPAQPTLRPAWDRNRDQVIRNVRREIWTALAKTARRLARQASAGRLSRTNRRFFEGER